MILLTSFVLAALIFAALLWGSRRSKAETTRMHASLEAVRLPLSKKNYSSDELIGLPEPVQKYFRAVLKDAQPMVAAVSIEHSGTMNMSTNGENWKRFTSTQSVIARRPGFDWEARIKIMPGLAARVHDAYIAGEGILHASLFGLVSLANLRGTPGMAQGELLRFLAEAAWYPTSLLPSQGVRWKAIDAASAEATLQDGETAATLLFRFNDDSVIQSLRAEARGRTVGDAVIPTPWEGEWSNYQLRDGMLIPTEGEVAWVLPDGPKVYWRGRITSPNCEFEQ
jgi:hypothetical protein